MLKAHTRGALEGLQTLLGLVRWLMDIMTMTIGDLLELASATRGRTDDLGFIRQKGFRPFLLALIFAILCQSC